MVLPAFYSLLEPPTLSWYQRRPSPDSSLKRLASSQLPRPQKRQSDDRPTPSSFSATRNEANKKKGIFVCEDGCKPVHLPHEFTSLKNRLLCTMFCTRGYACRFGANCNRAHLSSLAKLPANERTTIETWIDNEPSMSFAPGSEPQKIGKQIKKELE